MAENPLDTGRGILKLFLLSILLFLAILILTDLDLSHPTAVTLIIIGIIAVHVLLKYFTGKGLMNWVAEKFMGIK